MEIFPLPVRPPPLWAIQPAWPEAQTDRQPQAWQAGPQVWLDGPEEGTDGKKNLPILEQEKQDKGTADHLMPLGDWFFSFRSFLFLYVLLIIIIIHVFSP